MAKKEIFQEMTLEEARAYRASLAKPDAAKVLTAKEKREAFKIYWSQNKKKYGMTNKLENILWLHLVSIKNDSPDKFDAGLKNFGIKKV
jgi:hypothetical protein